MFKRLTIDSVSQLYVVCCYNLISYAAF